MVTDIAMVTMGNVEETSIALSNGMIDDLRGYDLPIPQNEGLKCTPL